MRIIAGRFKSRVLYLPPTKNRRGPKRITRPTTSLVRKALFDILAPCIAGSSFLDLYAGTGAIGLEALSREAGNIVMVESNFEILACLKDNIRQIAAEEEKNGRVVLLQKSTAAALAQLTSAQTNFDLIFADTPYSFSAVQFAEIIVAVSDSGLLKPGGRFILQHRYGLEKEPEFQKSAARFKQVSETRRYGATGLTFFTR